MRKETKEQDTKKVFESYTKRARETVKDTDKLEELLKQVEKRLAVLPKVGEAFACIPTFILLMRSYIKKEYTDIPIGSIIAIVGALIYLVSPIDLIPDAIPIAGYIDDAAVLAFALNQVKVDVDAYNEWRDQNK